MNARGIIAGGMVAVGGCAIAAFLSACNITEEPEFQGSEADGGRDSGFFSPDAEIETSSCTAETCCTAEGWLDLRNLHPTAAALRRPSVAAASNSDVVAIAYERLLADGSTDSVLTILAEKRVVGSTTIPGADDPVIAIGGGRLELVYEEGELVQWLRGETDGSLNPVDGFTTPTGDSPSVSATGQGAAIVWMEQSLDDDQIRCIVGVSTAGTQQLIMTCEPEEDAFRNPAVAFSRSAPEFLVAVVNHDDGPGNQGSDRINWWIGEEQEDDSLDLNTRSSAIATSLEGGSFLISAVGGSNRDRLRLLRVFPDPDIEQERRYFELNNRPIENPTFVSDNTGRVAIAWIANRDGKEILRIADAIEGASLTEDLVSMELLDNVDIDSPRPLSGSTHGNAGHLAVAVGAEDQETILLTRFLGMFKTCPID